MPDNDNRNPSVTDFDATADVSVERDEARAAVPTLALVPSQAAEALPFEHLGDNLPILCWIARADGYIDWYNRRWHEYCGSTPDAMEGWGWQSVHDPAELPRVMASWTESIASGESFEMVFPLRGADEVYRPFLTKASPMRDADGAVVRWFGVNIEIGAQLRAEAALDDSEAKYTVLTEAMPQMVWSTQADGHHDYFNARWYAFTGAPLGSSDSAAWIELFHPAERERAESRWRESLASGEPYEIEVRLRHHSGEHRWTLVRALPVRNARGRILRWIGTCTDIHEGKMAAAQNEMLNRELSHRIKNIFAIIGGLVRLSARRDPAVTPFARDLLDRIAALARAHEFARPHSEESRPPDFEPDLQGLLRELFLPYVQGGEARIAVRGDDSEIDDKGATPLALLFHELATNAAKYGALSVADGCVALDITRRDDEITLVWRESGGPAVGGPPVHEGFGSRLSKMSVEQQLGGRLTREWLPQGLEATVVVHRSRLIRTYAAQPGRQAP